MFAEFIKELVELVVKSSWVGDDRSVFNQYFLLIVLGLEQHYQQN